MVRYYHAEWATCRWHFHPIVVPAHGLGTALSSFFLCRGAQSRGAYAYHARS